jgi:hypothetical protein
VTIFCDMAPCTYTQVDRRFRSAYCLNQTMEAVSASDTSVNFYETKRRHIPEGCHIHARRRENLKSHSFVPILVQLSSVHTPFSTISSRCYSRSSTSGERHEPVCVCLPVAFFTTMVPGITLVQERLKFTIVRCSGTTVRWGSRCKKDVRRSDELVLY